MTYQNLSIAINLASAFIGLAALVYAIVRDRKKGPKDPEERSRVRPRTGPALPLGPRSGPPGGR